MNWKFALRIATSPCERWLKKAAEWNPVRDIKLTERLEDREKYGKMTSMISSNKYLKKRKMKNQSKEAVKPTIIRSTLPKTGEYGLFEKEITQALCKNDRR